MALRDIFLCKTTISVDFFIKIIDNAVVDLMMDINSIRDHATGVK